MSLKAPGAGLPNIVQAIEYLTASNRKGLGDRVPAFDSGRSTPGASGWWSWAAATPRWIAYVRP